jgi:hypothetical protein
MKTIVRLLALLTTACAMHSASAQRDPAFEKLMAERADRKKRAQASCQAEFSASWRLWRPMMRAGATEQGHYDVFVAPAEISGCYVEKSMPALQKWIDRESNAPPNQDPVARAKLAENIAMMCVFRFLASPQCTAGGLTTSARVDPPSSRVTPPAPAPSARPSVTPARPPSSADTGTAGQGDAAPGLPNRLRNEQRQAALDEQRRGRLKRHYTDREAHQCLTLWKEKTSYGGFTNTCAFPVRFIYCAYKPKKGAWTEAFNCEGEKAQFGGHALIKPHDRSSHHTLGAQKIFWFACRADSPTDEIFEVGDGEFDASVPAIRARCVKWGDRS